MKTSTPAQQIVEERGTPSWQAFGDALADCSFRLEVPGPVYVQSQTAFDEEGDIHIQIGQMSLGIGWEAGEALIYSLVSAMYGEDWGGAILALCLRTPMDEQPGRHQSDERIAAIQALWKAAYSYRAQWPDRVDLDDRLWGVPAPKGMQMKLPKEAQS